MFPNAPSQSLRRVKLTYYLYVTLFWFATVLPAAVQVLLIQARGFDLSQIGVVLGIYGFAVVLLELPTGGLADAIGRKRVTLLALGFILASLAVLLVAFSFVTLLAFAILSGAGRALSSGALEAWFIDSLQEVDPDAELQPALAVAGTFELFALGVGTLLSGVIPTFFGGLPEEGTAIFTPFSMTIVFSIAMFVVTFLAVVLLVKEDRSRLGDAEVSGFGTIPNLIREAVGLSRRNPTILLLLGAASVGGFALSGVETFWQPYFANLLGGSEGNSVLFGFLLAGSFGLGMVGNLLSTPLSKLFKKRYALVAALFGGIQGGMLLLLALQSTAGLATAFFWLVYFSRGTMNSPHATLFNSEVPAAKRSSMLSVQSLANYVGGGLGSIALGYVSEGFSISTAWMIAAGLLALSLPLYLLVDRRRARSLGDEAREKTL